MNVCGETKVVYQSTWSFELDTREWLLLPLNVGYMELADVNGTKLLQEILDDKTQTAVSEPVPLNQDGTRRQPNAQGKTVVDICEDVAGNEGFTVYTQEDFKTEFGEPCTPLPDTPCPPTGP